MTQARRTATKPEQKVDTNEEKVSQGWTIGAEPVEASAEGTNQGGIVLYLIAPPGDNHASRTSYVMSRVGIVRRNTANPKLDFDRVIDREIQKLRKAVQVLNDLRAEELL